MRYRPASLDALNFLLADVRGALGPFLVVYLTSEHGWTQSEVGLMGVATGLAGVALQTPAGALIDRIDARRAIITAALVVLVAGSLVMYATAAFWPVTISNACVSIVSDIFGPAVTALTLGLTAQPAWGRRIGRNSAFDHAGNICIALAVGAVGTLISKRAVFLLIPLFTGAAIAATLSIPPGAVDGRQARGLAPQEDAQEGAQEGAHDSVQDGTRDGSQGAMQAATSLRAMLACRPLIVLAGCVFLFHLANAAMLPLVGQELAAGHAHLADGLMSICIIAAQAVMLPLALLVGHKADRWGRKPIFVAAFLILPVRGVLYTLSRDPAWLVGVQILDGVGAGIYGAIVPLIVADLTRGTGRLNFAQGFVATTMGLGASLSPLVAGLAHDDLGGYRSAWLTLAAIAAVGLCAFTLLMPETGQARALGEGRVVLS